MKPYRFARRSFLAGTFALEISLRNMEAAAEGATAPARILLTPFPVDTYRQSYLPNGGQTAFTSSPVLQPSQSFFNGAPQTGTSADASLYQFLVSINAWYNQKTADILTMFKNAKDGFGNSVLDHTVVPYLTEVGDPSHSRGPKASLHLRREGARHEGRAVPQLREQCTPTGRRLADGGAGPAPKRRSARRATYHGEVQPHRRRPDQRPVGKARVRAGIRASAAGLDGNAPFSRSGRRVSTHRVPS